MMHALATEYMYIYLLKEFVFTGDKIQRQAYKAWLGDIQWLVLKYRSQNLEAIQVLFQLIRLPTLLMGSITLSMSYPMRVIVLLYTMKFTTLSNDSHYL
jgi:hypothetical protein